MESQLLLLSDEKFKELNKQLELFVDETGIWRWEGRLTH